MPKPSLNPDTFIDSSSGFGAGPGSYEVVRASFTVTKFGSDTNLNLTTYLEPINSQGERVRGAEEVRQDWGFGKAAIAAFHPAQGNTPEDDNPVDKGSDADAEGNTLCGDGAINNKSTGAAVFFHTLAHQGFPKAVLHRSWAPDFVGLKFALELMMPEDINTKFGMRLGRTPMPGKQTVDPRKVVAKWHNPAYISAVTGNGNGNSTAAAKDAPVEDAATGKTAEELAFECLEAVAKQKPGEKNQIKSQNALKGFFTSTWAKNKFPAKELPAAQKFIGDKAWTEEKTYEIGGTFDDWKIVFPEV